MDADALAWEAAANEFALYGRDYTTDPWLWAEDKLQEYWWSKQREIAVAVRDHRYVAVKSCHDAGKSFLVARLAAKWIDEHPLGEAFVVSTAPTGAQVSAVLWREIGKAHKKGKLPGRIVSSGFPTWKLDDGEQIGYGRKPADYDISAFQGIHARYVLIIIDEANGIDVNLFNAVDSLATNEYARVVAIGNPDDPTSHFSEVCKPDSGWHTIQIDGLLTPNFTKERVAALECHQCRKVGARETLLARLFREERIRHTTEDVPDDLRPMLLSPLWVEERLHRWVGHATTTQSLSEMANQSSLFVSKVRGLFPDTNSEGIIPLGWVERAMQRWVDWNEGDKKLPPGRPVIGADIAGKGEDETCFAIRIGALTIELRKHRQADTMEVTGFLTAALNAFEGQDPIAVVDSIGIGAGVLDRLRELEVPAIGFVASGSAVGLTDRSGEFKFTNLRAAAWWNMRELLDPSRNSDIMLPDDEMLKADLTAPRWKVLSGGKIQVESKEDIRKRLGRSTDSGDGVVQAHWIEFGGAGAGDVGTVSWWEGLSDDEVQSWGVEGMAETWQAAL